MKAQRVQAWACSNCGKTQVGNEHGRLFAEDCCTCVTPGCPNPSQYFGARTPCPTCANATELVRAEEALDAATKALRAIQDRILADRERVKKKASRG